MFVNLERQSFHDVLPIETDKSMKAQHKFTSDGQVVDFLAMRKRSQSEDLWEVSTRRKSGRS